MQLFIRKRNDQSNKNGQTKESPSQNKDQDLDLNQYQYLFSIFTNNINTIVKNNKNCLGQMDYYPKYRVSKQIQNQSQILLPSMYIKILHKLTKQSLARNALIMKGRQQYSIDYYAVFDAPLQQARKIKVITPTVSQLRKMLLEQQKHSKPLCNKQYRSKTISTLNTQQKNRSPISIFKSFQVDLSSALLSKITQIQNQPKDCFIRTTRSNISRTERHRIKNYFFPERKRQSLPLENLHENNQVEIDQGFVLINCKQESFDSKGQNLPEKAKPRNGFSSFRTQRSQGKRLSSNQEQTINDIQSFYEKTNIDLSWMNSRELGGYKPKTKRWLRNFN